MIQKQAFHLNFAQGLDTKTDPNQVAFGKFLSLENSIFQKGGLLQKRNGYGQLPSVLSTAQYLTTFNNDLTAIGTNLQAYSPGLSTWVNRGFIQPISLSTQTTIRNNLNQTQCDYAISSSNVGCIVYTEVNSGTNSYKYALNDAITGQNYLAPKVISGADATYGTPRVFYLAPYFIIVYSSTSGQLSYIAINTSSFTVNAPATISNNYAAATTVAFDGIVLNGNLYLIWNGSGSNGIKGAYVNSQLTFSSLKTIDASHQATNISVSADAANSAIWVHYYRLSTTNGYSAKCDLSLNVYSGFPVASISSVSVANISGTAANGSSTLFYEVNNNYTFGGGSIPSHYVNQVVVNSAASVSSPTLVARGIGIFGEAFTYNSVAYFLAVYQTSATTSYQNTYFLINSSGQIIGKLAYQNASGYAVTGLSSATLNGSQVIYAYLFADLIAAVNKNTNATGQTAAVYSQYGINLVNFNFETNFQSVEMGSNLNIPGGITWAYDGYSATEQNFFLYPDLITLSTATTGGSMIAQTYYYQVCYEWTDNQGNAFRSAPSIPVSIVVPGGTSTNTVTIKGPNLRLTYKTANPVKIVIYRWSTAQQIYYQTTSITAPILNSTTADSWTFTDTNADSTILGNSILYTTGGVVEDIGPPSFSSVFLFDDRMWGISSEDSNLLWFSKQVIEATPVEMSDLFTMYIPPSLGAQGPSGALKCGFPMDDKAVLFKQASISYFNGTGPDNTGANSQYSPPVLITSTLGCTNQNSIVFMPNGLMFEFQSEAGNQIWLLGRDLSTSYIGAPVEGLTLNATVQSAVNIPGTNQVRFTMSSGVTLMYDFFYQQWGTFVNVPAISATLYQGLHTYINGNQQVFQETPGSYLDGSNPVVMSFTTSWLNLTGIQGYQRAYFFYLLAQYLSPHKILCQIAYDYNPSVAQATLITPDNFTPTYGGTESNGQVTTYGQDSPYGGSGSVENWRIFLARQRCTSFQITLSEVYDPSLGVPAGAGFNLTGLNIVIGHKKDFRPIAAANSAG